MSLREIDGRSAKLASLSEEATAPLLPFTLPHGQLRFLHLHTCNCTVSFISSKTHTYVEKLLNI